MSNTELVQVNNAVCDHCTPVIDEEIFTQIVKVFPNNHIQIQVKTAKFVKRHRSQVVGHMFKQKTWFKQFICFWPLFCRRIGWISPQVQVTKMYIVIFVELVDVWCWISISANGRCKYDKNVTFRIPAGRWFNGTRLSAWEYFKNPFKKVERF